jgi:nitroreductase
MNKDDFKLLYESRHTIRKFLSDTIPDEDINYIIDSARLAPTGQNYQQWKFIAIRNKNILNEMAETVDNCLQKLYPKINDRDVIKKIEAFKFYYLFFKDAPLVIAVLGHPTKTFLSEILEMNNINSNYGELVDPDIFSLGAAVQNILLASTALGYGSAWMTGPVRFQNELEKILNIKSPYRLVSLIPVGKPGKKHNGPKKKSLDEVLSFID